MVTSAFDVALGDPWPARYPERVLRNDLTERWSGHAEQLADDSDAVSALVAGVADPDARWSPSTGARELGL